MKNSKRTYRDDTSTLTLRLWEFTGTALLNLFIFILLLVYLSPLSYMVVTSLKTRTQLQDGTSPLWPGELKTFVYEGKTYPIYKVPTKNGVQDLALVEPHQKYSMYIDPAHPEAGLIREEGFYRGLHRAYSPKITFDNFIQLWKVIDYPHVINNTLYVVIVSGIGVLLASIAVAYGFSRFRIPGGKYLFFLLIATIMIPDSILLIPSFVIFARVLGWNGSYLPLIVPPFFGSAVYIFLLRQNFKSIPRDLDEAAMLDGAGPLRILISIILPQSIPTVATVTLLHFFNMWNELRVSSLYLGIRQDLQTVAFTASITPTVGFTPELLQASTLLLLIVPVVVLLLSQRFFMQDMVITGLEK
ncbi:MAG TPA: carbohydrate ABC transporter permease [Anaerolineales bacterium]